MPDGLYDADVLVWSERQGGLLRRMAAGERVNDEVDWENVIEEVEAVGRSEFHAFENLVRQAMIHLLKLHAWPGSRSARHWQGEALEFLVQATRRYTPSMRQRVDTEAQYRLALRAFRLMEDESGSPLPVADACPFPLEALLAADAEPLILAELAGGRRG